MPLLLLLLSDGGGGGAETSRTNKRMHKFNKQYNFHSLFTCATIHPAYFSLHDVRHWVIGRFTAQFQVKRTSTHVVVVVADACLQLPIPSLFMLDTQICYCMHYH